MKYFKYFVTLNMILIFKILDISLWILIQILPGKLIIKFINLRPFKYIKIKPSKKFQIKIKQIILKILNIKSINNNFLSSCLSRSIVGQLFFDFIAIPNTISFGIEKSINGVKSNHCWIKDPQNGQNFTPASENFFK